MPSTAGAKTFIGKKSLPASGSVELVAGFRLEWLVAASSIPDERPEVALARKIAFSRYVSSLEPGVTIEFRLLPDRGPGGETRGVTAGVLYKREFPQQDGSADETMRRALGGFLPALLTHCPEAEFVACESGDSLGRLLGDPGMKTRWEIGHALLEVPMAGGLPRPSPVVGFGANAIERKDPTALGLVIPWIPSVSDWRRVAEMIYWSPSPIMLRVAARPAPLAASTAESELRGILESLDGDVAPAAGVDAQMIRRRLVERRNSLFNSSLFLSVTLSGAEEIPREAALVISGELSGEVRDFSDPWAAGDGAVACCTVSDSSFESDLRRRAANPGIRDLFTATETAGALRVPSPPPSHLDGFPIRRFRTNTAPPGAWDKEPGGLFLGVNSHRGVETRVHLSPEERRRHVYVIGQTGTGKSTLLERMILEDIENGNGLALVDPHGDLVQNVLCRMSPKRADDVIIFDFAESERPIAFNQLLWSTIAERDFIIEEFIASLIARLPVEMAGPMFEMYTRNFLKLLMGDQPRPDFVPTFADLPLLFQRPGFRKKLLSSMSDGILADFVREAEMNTSSEHKLSSVAGWITSKFSRLVSSEAALRSIGQTGCAIDFEKVMNEGRIVLISLAKGRIGQLSAELLCGLLVARFRATAMRRAEIPIERRRDFALYVDEFQNVASSSYSELLSEARKYRLNLVLANQFIAQLPDSVTQSILGNVGCLFAFRTGVNDAKLLADVFEPTFNARDLTELPILHAYVSCLVGGGEVSRPFSVRCPREWPVKNQEQARAIRKASGLRWGSDAKQVDEDFRRRREAIIALG